MVLLGASACLLALPWLRGQAGTPAFHAPAYGKAVREAAAARGRTAVHGFKEDFEAWRTSLSSEEQALIQEQAQGEFNKAFRKSDTFKKDLPEEKVKAFSKILGKFFENEAEDYKKEEAARAPDYDGLLKKAGDKQLDFSLKNKVVEINRDADRRYNYATMRIRMAEAEGDDAKRFPQSSPLVAEWQVLNNDTESHENAKSVIEFLQKARDLPTCPDDVKPLIDEWVKKGVPPMGEAFRLLLPEVLMEQTTFLKDTLHGAISRAAENATEEEVKTYAEKTVPEIAAKVIKWLSDNYVSARDEVEDANDKMKAFFRSQAERKDQGLTKADILKEIWAELPKHTSAPVPPLDDEMLAELAKEPAVQEGEFMHSWGTADRLYKSEAIDAFGAKYLLGVFETKEEAQKAFADWNLEYEKSRDEMKVEMAQWSKIEQAKLDKDAESEGTQRIRKMIAEARQR